MATKKKVETPAETLETENSVGESESIGAGLMDFELPPVTDTGNDFIEDTPPDSGDTSTNDTPEQADGRTDNLYSGKPDDPAEAHRGQLSEGGEAYDPAQHVYPPSQTGKTKRWRKKPKKQMEQEQAERAKTATPDIGALNRQKAENTAYFYGSLHPYVFPDGDTKTDELLPLINSLERVYNEFGSVDIDPRIAALLNAGAYSMRVARREKNKAVSTSIAAKVKGAFMWSMVKMRLWTPGKKKDEVDTSGEPLTSKTG